MQIFIKKAKRSFSGCCRLFAPETLTSGSPTTAHTCSSSPSDIHCGCGLKSWLLSQSPGVEPGKKGRVITTHTAPPLPSLYWASAESHLQRLWDTFDWAQDILIIWVFVGQACAEKNGWFKLFQTTGREWETAQSGHFKGHLEAEERSRSTEMCWYLSSSLR